MVDLFLLSTARFFFNLKKNALLLNCPNCIQFKHYHSRLIFSSFQAVKWFSTAFLINLYLFMNYLPSSTINVICLILWLEMRTKKCWITHFHLRFFLHFWFLYMLISSLNLDRNTLEFKSFWFWLSLKETPIHRFFVFLK